MEEHGEGPDQQDQRGKPSAALTEGSTVLSTMASSPVRMGTASCSSWARMALRREVAPDPSGSATAGYAGSGPCCEVMMATSSG